MSRQPYLSSLAAGSGFYRSSADFVCRIRSRFNRLKWRGMDRRLETTKPEEAMSRNSGQVFRLRRDELTGGDMHDRFIDDGQVLCVGDQ